MVKKTPAYKNKLRALELEHNKEATRKKKGSKQIIKYWFSISLSLILVLEKLVDKNCINYLIIVSIRFLILIFIFLIENIVKSVTY